MKFPIFHNFRTNKSGAALVEFSILIPVIFFGAFGMMEFGRALYQFHVANKGVKAAARYLARTTASPGCPPVGTNWSAAQTNAKNLAIRGSLDTSSPLLLPNWDQTTDVTIAVSCVSNVAQNGNPAPFRGPDSIPVLTVSTEFPFDDLGILTTLGLGTITIAANHQELFVGD